MAVDGPHSQGGDDDKVGPAGLRDEVLVQKVDVKDTFAAAAGGGATSHDVQPAAGEVWQITLFAAITAGGGADDLDIYLRTDNADTFHISDGDENTPVATGNYVISNDCYLRITCTTGVAGGNRTITYWYQAFKLI